MHGRLSIHIAARLSEHGGLHDCPAKIHGVMLHKAARCHNFDGGFFFKVGEQPAAYLMDTPGVMVPNVQDELTGMRLALTGTVNYCVENCNSQERCLCSKFA